MTRRSPPSLRRSKSLKSNLMNPKMKKKSLLRRTTRRLMLKMPRLLRTRPPRIIRRLRPRLRTIKLRLSLPTRKLMMLPRRTDQ